MREKYDRRRHAGEQIAQGGDMSSAPDSGHQAQGLDVDVLAVAAEIEELAGPVLAQLIAAGMPARWPWPLLRQRPDAHGRSFTRQIANLGWPTMRRCNLPVGRFRVRPEHAGIRLVAGRVRPRPCAVRQRGRPR